MATPKDEYLMPITDMLVDATADHEILSFMDGHTDYNQIFIAEEGVSKCLSDARGPLELLNR